MFFARLARFVLRYRLLVGVALLATAAFGFRGALQVTPDFTLTSFFGANDPEQDYLQYYHDKWGPDDAMILVIVEAENGTVLTGERLRLLEEISVALKRKEESVKSVRSLSNVERVLSRQEGTEWVLETRPLIDTMPSNPDESSPAWAKWRLEILEDSLLVPLIISKDGRASGIVVELKKSTNNILNVAPMVADIRQVLDAYEGTAGLHLNAAGIPAVRADFFGLFFQDSRRFGLLSGVFVLLSMFFIFRSFHGVIIPGLAAAFPVIMVFGIMGYSGENIGLINQAYITVLPAIAVADAIHLLTRFHEEARLVATPGERLTPTQRNEAIERALSRVGVACLLTSLTTAVGFGSLYVAEMPTIQSFGYFAAFGILFAYGSVLFIIPLALSFVRGAAIKEQNKRIAMDGLLERCANIAIYRPVLVLFCTALVVSGCLFLGSRVILDNNITNLLDSEHPTSQANRVLDKELGGILTLEVDLLDHRPPLPPADISVFEEGLEEDTVVFDLDSEFEDNPDPADIGDVMSENESPVPMLRNPEILRGIFAVEQWVRSQEAVRFVVSPATYIATTNALMTGPGIKAEDVGIPTDQSQIGHLFEQIQGNEDLDKIQRNYDTWGRMLIRMSDIGGLAFADLAQKLREELKKNLGKLPLYTHISGTPFIAYRGVNNITTDLRNSLLIAFFIITGVIALLLRNVRLALICLLPNALPLLVGYGMMGAMEWMLEPSAALVFTVALGIAVDDTLHLIVRCQEELGKGASLEEALHSAIIHSGRAVGITTIILCVAFGVMAFSAFSQMMIMGSLGAVVIFAALLCDLFVLPALMILFGRGGWVSKHQGVVAGR